MKLYKPLQQNIKINKNMSYDYMHYCGWFEYACTTRRIGTCFKIAEVFYNFFFLYVINNYTYYTNVHIIRVLHNHINISACLYILIFRNLRIMY